jgi:hypothetical protein
VFPSASALYSKTRATAFRRRKFGESLRVFKRRRDRPSPPAHASQRRVPGVDHEPLDCGSPSGHDALLIRVLSDAGLPGSSYAPSDRFRNGCAESHRDYDPGERPGDRRHCHSAGLRRARRAQLEAARGTYALRPRTKTHTTVRWHSPKRCPGW